MFRAFTFIILFLFSINLYAYELVIIQGLSKEKQTFVTRNSSKLKKETKMFEGKKVTFTNDNVSIIAVAKNVSTEFTQWEIENDFTDVPFQRGDLVTMYDTTEYLWALTPEKIKRKYVKNSIYRPRRSLEGHLSFTKALSESVSGTTPQNVDRGGYQVELTFRKEFNLNYAIAYGVRFSRDVINLAESSLINTRFLGVFEGRYYFDPMENFYNAQVGLALGFGIGQSRTESEGDVTFGSAFMLPSTKISLMFPINKEYDFEFIAAFESLRLDESDTDNIDQTTNLTNSKTGIMIRRHF